MSSTFIVKNSGIVFMKSEEDNKYYTFNGADWTLFKGEGGQASISQEQGNDLEQKGDGLYISKNIEWVVD